MPPSRTAAALGVLCLAFAGPAGAAAHKGGAVRITEVRPACADTAIVCTIETAGVPDAPSLETLQSGLPSALVYGMSLVDWRGEELGGLRAEIRIEPNLWEEHFVVRTPLGELRVDSLSAVATLLSSLGPFPVRSLRGLAPDRMYRVRVRVAVHPLAPSEIHRVREIFAGEARSDDPDRREVAVGLDSLIRLFLGRGPSEDWAADATSEPFILRALPRHVAAPEPTIPREEP
jgi:hypothetical protein